MTRISKATEYNWKKLNCDSTEKLTKRANKTQSKKQEKSCCKQLSGFCSSKSASFKNYANRSIHREYNVFSMYLYIGVSQHP